jgi:hypothetical protein
MLPTNRPPTHPGEMLLKEFLEPLGVSQVEMPPHQADASCTSAAAAMAVNRSSPKPRNSVASTKADEKKNGAGTPSESNAHP